eukprot:CAMPEP_0194486978 /NCGR_PEP_ID=MMETSP0253-20130528/7428_1 /TAXON_ID=2966 /ORGANISM="Noctiluca scintillans" /LENGTH=110 /DNA_ID=CAMNT_0039327131 /DNA_START=37 /DNA_END=369 /DNA_ORIENTATION=-
MSFWGYALKPGATHTPKSAQNEVLHLSQACLHKPVDGKNALEVSDDSNSYALMILEKGKTEYASFDLFFNSGKYTFRNKGKSEIHLTGYFEPEALGEDSEEEVAPKKQRK